MTAFSRARARAADTCHWCHRIWCLAVDLADGRSIGACGQHVDLLPPWIDQ